MRSIFRLVGTIRFAVGTAIVLIALMSQGEISEIWTGVLILVGAIVGVAAATTWLLLTFYFLILPFGTLGMIWLSSELWNGGTYLDVVRAQYGYLYFIWAMGLFSVPLLVYYHNRSWIFMTRKFSIDAAPGDTKDPELFAIGVVEISGMPYVAAATISEQGLIVDRRNFHPVVLPWRWVLSIEPDTNADARNPAAVVAMRNDDNDYLTLSVPWNRDLLELSTGRGESSVIAPQ